MQMVLTFLPMLRNGCVNVMRLIRKYVLKPIEIRRWGVIEHETYRETFRKSRTNLLRD